MNGAARKKDRQRWHSVVLRPGESRPRAEAAFETIAPLSILERLALVWTLSQEACRLAGLGDGERRLPRPHRRTSGS